nr:Flp family type IVb pilin [Johnsonella ignava]
MKKLMNTFLNEESGQGLVEYGLILALISIVVIGILRIVGNKLNNTFNSIQSSL